MKCFSFLLILFLNLLFLFSASNDDEFLLPKEEEVLYINSYELVKYRGKLQVIYSDAPIYAYTYFVASNIKEDEYGNPIGYENAYTLVAGNEISISFNEEYIIFIGNGYISFGGPKTYNLNFNVKTEIILPFSFNYRIYKLNKIEGNTLEVLIDDPNVNINIENTDYICNSKCIMPISGEYNIFLYNYNSAKNAKIKLLYTSRKDQYDIDIEKGDTVKYIFSGQTFYYRISSSLSSEYYQNEEGILLVSGKPSIMSEQLDYEIRNYNSTHELYYFYPYKMSINLEVTPLNEEGEISIKGIKPTIVKNFKQTFNYDVPKGIGPQYFRINIDKAIKDDFTFNFGTKVNWFEGTMFDGNLNLNTGKEISSFDISSNDAGKTYTAIYNNTGKFTSKKKFYWETLNKYQYKYFKLNPGEEKVFKYIQKETSSSLVNFENGYTGTKAKIYVYYSEDNIDYDASDRKYFNFKQEYSTWDQKIIINSKTIYLIIQADEYYEDYISFRSQDIVLKNEEPQEFNEFNGYNFIGYSLSLENGKNTIEILTNVHEILTISLFKDTTEIYFCFNISCKFSFNKDLLSEYYIYIKNTGTELGIKTPKLYILQYQDLETYQIPTDKFYLKNFLLPFEYKFQIYDSSLISNINSNKEFVISSQIPSNQENYNIKIYYENLESIAIDDEQYKGYKHYYFNLKNKEVISSLIITVIGKWDENKFLPFEKIGFAYSGPYLVDFNEAKLVKNNFKGNNIFFKVKNLFNDQKYLFSMTNDAKLIIGDLFKENGVLNDEYQSSSKYMLNEDLFKSNNIITVKYSGTNKAELYYELLEGEVIKNSKYNDYKKYILNFNDNNKIHYLGLYDQNINTYAYINNEDNNINILYKDGNDKLSPVLPTVNKNKNFFPLVSQYNLITFTRNKDSIAASNKEFIIFNPELTEENLYYPNQGTFYLKRNTDKLIKLKNDSSEKDVYRIVTRSYEEYSVELNINLNYKYILNNTNKYTNVWEVSKGEPFYFKALASENNLLFMKILEGSIYNSFILSNNTNIELNSNNILLKIYLFQNSSEFEIDITNSKKTKFYYKLYNIPIINDSIEKGKQLRTLTLPILSYERDESNYLLNSDTCKIKYRNPYYQKNGRDFEYYFALSYEQDLENPIDQQKYEIKIIYNDKIDNNYPTIKFTTPFYFNKYDEKYRLEKYNYNDEANLVLTFITYDIDLIANIENENMDNLESINLNKTYIRRIIDKQKIDSLINYQVEIKNARKDSRDICVLFYFDFTNELTDINNFEKYNDINILKINRNENKISWNAFENVDYYEIYISKDLSKVNLFNNDCYLNKLKNDNKTDLKIIKEAKNEYEFEKKTQKLAVTVVAVDKKYKIRFVYNSITYDYKKSYALMIILICTGSVVFIGILILVLCLCLRKKKPSQAKDYNISMSEDLNINVQ